ncbi:MAG: hypothetical protein GX543_10315 [Gordonia sp.]|nr:hypothetical protein [Gordonia sp. (in: high G+C Gram-positive bacteria)]
MLPNISALWFIDCPDPAAELRAGAYIDPAATTDFMERAFTDAELTPIGTSDLAAAVDGADNRVFVAHYGRLAVLAGTSLRTADPHEMTSYLTDLGVGHTWALISVDPGADIGGFARWEGGEVQRAFFGTSSTISVDVGLPYPFEGPFWAGGHPQRSPNQPLALPFHPGALADAANHAWFGFGFHETDPVVDPALLPVTVYRIGPDDGRDGFVESSVPLHVPTTAREPELAAATAVPAAAETPPAPTEGFGEYQTEPIETVPAAAPAAAEERTPGPLSRFFGFRGRL